MVTWSQKEALRPYERQPPEVTPLKFHHPKTSRGLVETAHRTFKRRRDSKTIGISISAGASCRIRHGYELESGTDTFMDRKVRHAREMVHGHRIAQYVV